MKAITGMLPRKLYTDFDRTLMGSEVRQHCATNNCLILAAPKDQQHQNGLVERRWQTLCRMARAFITDKQMPKSYWYWAIKHANQVMNTFPIVLNKQLTTPMEVATGTKPDLRQLFSLFSTAFFSKLEDSTTKRTNMQSHTMQGIAVGWCEKANGMNIYNPLTKQLYTTNLFRPDESMSTKNYFNLSYNGGMFVGLYSEDCEKLIKEDFPIGTAVSIPSNTGSKLGFVSAVPAITSINDPLYTISLTDGTTTTVPRSLMSQFVDTKRTSVDITLPTWIQNNAKV